MLVREIEALALDVDGVLTDGIVLIGVNGEETKGIALRDLDALASARRAGLRLALVSGESGPMLDAIARRIGVDCVIDGAKDKRAGILQLCDRLGMLPERVCFVGDADRDALAFPIVGLALTPADGSLMARRAAHRVLVAQGGRGAVTEAVEFLLAARNSPILHAEQAMRGILEASVRAHQKLLEEPLAVLAAIARVFVEALGSGKKVLFCGNGASAADAQRFAAELVGRFAVDREPWPAIALTTDPSIVTAIANDFEFQEVFARQVRAFAQPGDLVVGISPSGQSENVVRALRAARERGGTSIAFVGLSGGLVAEVADLVFKAPDASTPRIQELQILAWHGICEIVEAALAKPRNPRDDRS